MTPSVSLHKPPHVPDMTNNRSPNAIAVLALSKDYHSHFEPLYGTPDWEIVETDQWNAKTVNEISPDILLIHSCDWYKAVSCIEEAKRLNIPSLLMVDSTIEWRHEWENPKFGAGGGAPYNQLASTNKIACLGWQSARTLEVVNRKGTGYYSIT